MHFDVRLENCNAICVGVQNPIFKYFGLRLAGRYTDRHVILQFAAAKVLVLLEIRTS